jgi:ZIP family zinc transporter
MDHNVLFALFVTLLAGLSTGIGGLLAFVIKQENRKILSWGLGFSAGVMIYVSFVELFRQAEISLVASLGATIGQWITVLSFFGGILLSILLDRLVPEQTSYHDMKLGEGPDETPRLEHKLKRMGIFTAFAIALHNFPEGLATFVGAVEEPLIGVSLAVAIAIHNIPEGMSVALPIYYATGDKVKAFWLALLSGLAEPVGGLAGYLILRSFFNEFIFGITFAAVAGIMVYVSLDELLPMARESGTGHIEMTGLVMGMMVMAVSLLLF